MTKPTSRRSAKSPRKSEIDVFYEALVWSRWYATRCHARQSHHHLRARTADLWNDWQEFARDTCEIEPGTIETFAQRLRNDDFKQVVTENQSYFLGIILDRRSDTSDR